jgi:hypothetical protein
MASSRRKAIFLWMDQGKLLFLGGEVKIWGLKNNWRTVFGPITSTII